MELKTVAYPKVNLCLYVGKKRKDGLHEILSIFQRIENFKDEITMEVSDDSKAEISVDGVDCALEDNSVYKAIKLWQVKTGISYSVKVSIKKNIPQRAGLGGGSSDAGSVLLALENINKNKIPFTELIKLGFEVGADVPFFLYDTKCAVVSGAGEEVMPIVPRELNFSLKDSGFSKPSTKDAYEKLDLIRKTQTTELPSLCLVESIYRKNISEWSFENSFASLYPSIPDGYSLTGSGSWIFNVSE